MRLTLPSLAIALAIPPVAVAQNPAAPKVFTHADTLRGTITPQRAWWDAAFYDLHVAISPRDSSIRGWNDITYRVTAPDHQEMQIDLQMPLVIDSVVQDGVAQKFRRDGNAYFVLLTAPQRRIAIKSVRVFYHGKPVVAVRPPWDGGFIFSKDSLGRPWIATANQGLGASVWWPNKDTQADEPDSQRVAITVPDPMINVSNGRLRSIKGNGDGTTTYEWFVSSPINNYGISVNAGTYAHLTDSLKGERGMLTLDYWPLAIHADTARVQFQQAKTMLTCFEHWFGPYPWYQDGFKLVETPHLGMEHQSAVAYGNAYKNGYRGRDLSGTGRGLKWDFIIIHEAAHEWFGNNITTKDIADMWVHESFANYAEGLYTECREGKQAGAEYIIGSRRNIVNDKPIVGPFGVNEEGSGDMYYKGGSMLHMIRQLVDDDEKWRGVLRGLQSTFGRTTVTGQQVRDFISRRSGMDLSKVFHQYLETKQVPVLEYRIDGQTLAFRWAEAVPGFDMPVKVLAGDPAPRLLRPRAEWQTVRLATPTSEVKPDPNFFVIVRKAQ